MSLPLDLETKLMSSVVKQIPFVLNTNVDMSAVENVLLIDSAVSDSKLFYDSSNANTFPMIYSTGSCKKDLLALLQNNFTSIKRIAFIFHDFGPGFYNTFLDQHFLFTAKDLLEPCNAYSENMQLLIDLIKQYNIQNIDFLACNTLQYSNWVAFYDILHKVTGVIVGASNDKTGNILYGGDWLLESTNTDIITTYFSNESGLTSYTRTLATSTISASTTLNNTNLNDGTYTWPITINGGTVDVPTVITFSENITLSTDANQYFIIGSAYVTIDGTNKTITIADIPDYLGLIQNGILNINVGGKRNVIITRINMTSSGTSSLLPNNGAWLCQIGYSNASINNIISYCTVYTILVVDIPNISIVGNYAGLYRGNLTISNCSGNGSICGDYAGYSRGTITINNCFNIGPINAQGGGGICGSLAGYDNGIIQISNCYSTGDITASYAGGICGDVAGLVNGTVTISNCYSTGSILTSKGGGICATRVGAYGSICNITNCYSTGNISGDNAGGIVGAEVGFNNTNAVTISQCYSMGLITNPTAGGICGGTDDNGDYSVTSITVSNCYMYSTGSIISPTLQVVIIPTNCYAANSSWSDTDANVNLLSYPTSLYVNNPGSVWTTIATNTPYLLSAFNKQIYHPNSSGNITGITTYNTRPGIFIGPGYTYTLLNVNNIDPATYNDTINSSTGVITFNNIVENTEYNANIFVGEKDVNNNYINYNVNSFLLGARLPSTISTSTTLNDTNLNDGTYNWPITITGGSASVPTVITFSENITLSADANQYFIIGSAYVTIDGTNKTITIADIPDYLGLIQNGILNINVGGKRNVIITRINMTSSGTSSLLPNNGAWLCQIGYSNASINNIISYCTVYTILVVDIPNISIVGNYAGLYRGNLTISNCSGNGSICGDYAGSNRGTIIINNCFNIGPINALYAGGICGSSAGYDNGIIQISNCYSTGSITASYAGGICGSSAGLINGTVTISNCYSTGSILASAGGSGGICGGFVGRYAGNCNIINCYSTGNISGDNAGGIVGAELGISPTGPASNVTITQCYSMGLITNPTAGGICGGTDGHGDYPVTGITVSNCYMYSTGTIISPTLQVIIIPTNCYIANSSWSDTDANVNLLSYPISLYVSNPGSVWTSAATNTPYLLSGFNKQIYNPNSSGITVGITTYNTTPGLFTGSGYTYTLLNVNNLDPSTYNDTIDPSTGVITFNNIVENVEYNANVLVTQKDVNNNYINYNVNSFLLGTNIPVGTISTSTTLNNTNLNDGTYTWPITINGGSASVPTVITFSENVTLSTDANQYFIIGSEYVTIDGTNNTITIANIPDYLGLIKNGGAVDTEPGKNFITVTNINMASSGTSSLLPNNGWLCQSGYGCASYANNISYCTASSILSLGGSIIGSNVSCYGGIIDIRYCSNSGTGGICGNFAGNTNGYVYIVNCFNTGPVIDNTGGMCGVSAGINRGTIIIAGCYNTGAITGSQSGGICSKSTGYTNGNVQIEYCYNTGAIIGSQSGGICSSIGSDLGYVSIANCYNTGNISGNYSGGIVGKDMDLNNNGVLIIRKCYSTGSILASGGGGICGGSMGRYNTITDCYSTGGISGDNAGGIVGAEVGYSSVINNIVTITQCYSVGLITNPTAGGICGGTAGDGDYPVTGITVSNCYMYATGSIISPTLQVIIIPTNCYVANSSWSDTDANVNLLSYPISLYVSNPGSVWTSAATNTPYLLSVFNEQIYNPNSSGSISEITTYNTTPGMFIGPGYTYTLLNVNNLDPATYNDTIDPSTGVITFNNIVANANYNANVFVSQTDSNNNYINYNVNSFLLQTTATNTISSSRTLNNTNLNDGTYIWPITITGGSASVPTVITFSENVTLSTDANKYFIIGSNYVTIDGTNKTITIADIPDYIGLIKNGGSVDTEPGKSNVTVTRINMASSGTSSLLPNNGAWLCQSGYGCASYANRISYCTASSILSLGGSIIGQYVGCYGGNIFISNCSNSGTGGICSDGPGLNNGTVTISNCFNTGPVIDSTGGICGDSAGQNNGNVIINNCYNTGVITGSQSGGICSSFIGRNNGVVTISNCYNTGSISGNYSGGIIGISTGLNNGTVTISNCYNTGSIMTSSGGGICASYLGRNCNQCTITNCYSTGGISGDNAGGIVGAEVGYNTNTGTSNIVTITQCYSMGLITNPTAGGICGGTAGDGDYPVTGITISNCYMYSTGSIISPTLQVIIVPTNCYIANTEWSDTDANVNLLSYPTSLYVNNPGSVWTSAATNTPYLLSGFNSQIYNPNSSGSIDGITTYNTTPGMFIGPGYTYTLLNVNNLDPATYNDTIDPSTGVITFNNLLAYTEYNANVLVSQTDSNNNNVNNVNYNVNSFLLGPILCFLEGTQILCFVDGKEVYIKIEDIRKGTLVKTLLHGYQKVDIISSRQMYNSCDDTRIINKLYKCSVENYPDLHADLIITGGHSILVDELSEDHTNKTLKIWKWLIKTDGKYRLLSSLDERAVPYQKEGIFTLWHFALENADHRANYGVYANGLLVESCSKALITKFLGMRAVL